MRLIDELNDLHAHYVEAINAAVARDDYALAERLAHAYEEEAVQLIAERENRTHLLPLQRSRVVESALRRTVRRLRSGRAA